MQTSSTDPLEAVYERTEAGQTEVVHAQLPLSARERLALTVFTGFTPLTQLQTLWGADPLPLASVRKMLTLGLIRATDGAVHRYFNLGWPVGDSGAL